MLRMPLCLRSPTSLLLLLAASAVLAGCPSQAIEPADCEAMGPFEVRMSARNADTPLQDDAEVSVFTPPQRGVATELDVRLTGVAPDDLQSVRVDVMDLEGEALGAEMYLADGLPFTCEAAEVLLLRAMPVPFAPAFELPEDLDGVEAILQVRVESIDGDIAEVTRSVTLRAAPY